jgi:sortase B
MDYTFIFKINKDTISINTTKRTIDKKGLNNTNVIDTKDLRFSPEYIQENMDLVSTFLNVVILKKNITICTINTDAHLEDLVSLVNCWEHIDKLIFKQDITINFDIFMKLLENNYLSSMECYNMPKYLMERLDMNKKMKIITREKYNYKSTFMIDNLLSSYSDIYYKKNIVITTTFEGDELNELKNFMAINNNLRTVRFVNYSNEAMALVLNEIKNFNKKNVTIIIDEKTNDLDMVYKAIPYLKKNYKKYINDHNIKFKIKYSFEYKKKNFMKEYNLKLLSTIILIIIIILLFVFGVNYYKEYIDANKVDDQMVEINDILSEFTEQVDAPEDVDVIGDETQTGQTNNYAGTYYTNYSRVFDELLQINDDTVGWLKVNNTRIDYPVVQGNDNKYYLFRDFKKNKNSMGWVFMDFRNNPNDLDPNTIIYGHNIKGGIMFGQLSQLLQKSYLSKESNNYITFNTKQGNMKWRIFSVYRIPETTDYLQNNFYTKEDFKAFINMIQSRSTHQFNVTVTENDKILTLSTCSTNKTRNVVHAVLVETTPNTPEKVEPITESPTTVVNN